MKIKIEFIKHKNIKNNNLYYMTLKIIPWVDKYRPNKLDFIVHQPELIKTLHKILETGEMPHLLFHGPPGTGKTTTILALAKELFGPIKFKERVLELNASDDRGINVVRNDIMSFAKSIIGNPDKNYKSPPYKILILDEADAMTPDAQSALRKIMEETSSLTRFCLICNYVDKIIDPIISRCMPFRFMSISDDIMKNRLQFIGKKENINIDDDVYDTITYVVNGDLRKGIMLLQNIKYILFAKKSVTSNDVYDLVGYIPTKYVKIFVDMCFKKEKINIMEITYKFNAMGYPISNLCEQLCLYVINSNEISDIIKSKIIKIIAKISDNLNDGSNEFIQLALLVSSINYLFIK